MKYSRSTTGIYPLPLLGTVIVMLSCSSNAPVPRIEDEVRAWPEDSPSPRIEYVQSVMRAEDMGIRQGLMGFLKTIAVGKEDTNIVLPMAVVSSVKGQLFVADAGRKGIHRFDSERNKYQFIKRERSLDFISPVGMAADDEGNIYVADSELAKVFIIPLDKDEAIPVPFKEDFVRPTGIVIDNESGWIYVVDTGIHSVYIFGEDRALVKRFGYRGSDKGEFNYPTYISQSKSGKLLVTDSLNFRIQIFDRFGAYISQFGSAGNGTGDLARPKGIAEDEYGHIYIADALFQTIQVFDNIGTFLINFGEQGSGPGQFWLPAGISISDNGLIYVADSYNRRVQIFKYIGTMP